MAIARLNFHISFLHTQVYTLLHCLIYYPSILWSHPGILMCILLFRTMCFQQLILSPHIVLSFFLPSHTFTYLVTTRTFTSPNNTILYSHSLQNSLCKVIQIIPQDLPFLFHPSHLHTYTHNNYYDYYYYYYYYIILLLLIFQLHQFVYSQLYIFSSWAAHLLPINPLLLLLLLLL